LYKPTLAQAAGRGEAMDDTGMTYAERVALVEQALET
jgi:hypothetical protein